MASVNLTCATCTSNEPCALCRAIARALRAAGHSVTQTSRYDALRAAAAGTYGFEACIITVGAHERAIDDAARSLLAHSRVALVIEPGATTPAAMPSNFTVIESADWQKSPFPTDWITNLEPRGSARDVEPGTAQETRPLPQLGDTSAQFEPARRRLKSIATRVRHDINAAGFPEGQRLDLLATLEDEIAWAKMSGTGFGLVLILAKEKDRSGKLHDAELALASLKACVSGTARSSDVISEGNDSLLLILSEAASDETDAVARRIKKAVRRAIKEASRDKSLAPALRQIRLGTSVYPAHGTTRAALLARATASAQPIT